MLIYPSLLNYVKDSKDITNDCGNCLSGKGARHSWNKNSLSKVRVRFVRFVRNVRQMAWLVGHRGTPRWAMKAGKSEDLAWEVEGLRLGS